MSARASLLDERGSRGSLNPCCCQPDLNSDMMSSAFYLLNVELCHLDLVDPRLCTARLQAVLSCSALVCTANVKNDNDIDLSLLRALTRRLTWPRGPQCAGGVALYFITNLFTPQISPNNAFASARLAINRSRCHVIGCSTTLACSKRQILEARAFKVVFTAVRTACASMPFHITRVTRPRARRLTAERLASSSSWPPRQHLEPLWLSANIGDCAMSNGSLQSPISRNSTADRRLHRVSIDQ